MKTALLENCKKQSKTWPAGPAHQILRMMGYRSPRRISMEAALRLADALGCISYGKAMALWEAENDADAALPEPARPRRKRAV